MKTPFREKIITGFLTVLFAVFFVVFLGTVLTYAAQYLHLFPAQAPLSSADYLIQKATDTPDLRVRVVLMDTAHTQYTGAITRLNQNYLCLMDESAESTGEVCVQQKAIGATVFLEPTDEVTR